MEIEVQQFLRLWALGFERGGGATEWLADDGEPCLGMVDMTMLHYASLCLTMLKLDDNG